MRPDLQCQSYKHTHTHTNTHTHTHTQIPKYSPNDLKEYLKITNINYGTINIILNEFAAYSYYNFRLKNTNP
jgi:hypothetical protein